MKFTDLFIKRPVLATCINLLVLVAGIYAITTINVRQYPRSDVAVVKVNTVYVGANADLVRGYITTPLERVIASADGIDYLESSSKQGLSTITAHLRLNFNTNDALTQIQSKVNQVRNDLPPEAQSPTIEVESQDTQFAAMYLSFYSKDLTQTQITDYLLRVVQPQLSAIAGVQKADILGARTFAMRIWLKPESLAGFGLSPSEVTEAIQANNFLSAVGNTKGNMVSVNLTADTDLKSKEDFENLIVKSDGTSVVRLKDIADVTLGAESYEEDVRFSGETATFMGIFVLPNSNSLDVIKSVREALPTIEARAPAGMKVKVAYDSTAYIRDAINEVIKTLTETVFIVIIVIFLFVGSLRGVLVPVVAIPLSLIGVASLMMALGFTLNLLTLLAVVLAVGLVVDDAIVMLENVERHMKEGLSGFDAAIKAARELAGPIIAMTITLAAVYAPIGLQGGLTGTLFREFAFTLAGAVIVSGFVALTLSPMMASKLLQSNEEPSKLKSVIDNFLATLTERYRSALEVVLEKKVFFLTIALVLVLLLPILYMFSNKELAPREDQGVVFGIVLASPNSTLDQTMLYASKLNDVFESFPENAQSFQLINPQGGFSGMLVKPWGERSRTTLEMEGEAWGKASAIPGIRMIVTTPPPLPGGSDFPVELIISSTAQPKEIVDFANQLVGTAFQSGGYMFADTDLKFDLPQTEVIIDKEKVASFGLTLRDVGADLSAFLGGDYVNRFNILGRSYKVIPQGKRVDRLNPEQINNIYISGPKGEVIPASTVVTFKNTVEARQLNRFQQLNSAKIQGAPVPGMSVDQALKILEDKAKEILPPGYSIDYAGESRQLRKESGGMVGTLLLAILVIFLVLASQFESFRDPLIILAGSVPLALAGALVFVFLGFTSLNIYSQVGLVTLVGLIAKNGILIVEFANVLRERGTEKIEAILEATSVRLRPVLMTSVATVVGHFPLVLASGAGAAARNSIGWVLVTGMIIGTIFTLFILPCIYVLIAGEHTQNNDPDEDIQIMNRSSMTEIMQ